MTSKESRTVLRGTGFCEESCLLDCRFRKRNLKAFQSLFTQVLQKACAMQLVSLGTVSLDGTKIKANASKHKAMS